VVVIYASAIPEHLALGRIEAGRNGGAERELIVRQERKPLLIRKLALLNDIPQKFCSGHIDRECLDLESDLNGKVDKRERKVGGGEARECHTVPEQLELCGDDIHDLHVDDVNE